MYINWIIVKIIFFLSIPQSRATTLLNMPTQIKLVLSRNNTLGRNSRGRDVTGRVSEIDGSTMNPVDLA